METVTDFEEECFNYAQFMNCELISPIHDAAARGNILELQKLLNDPLDKKPLNEKINIVDEAGNTPLHWACGSGHEEIVSFLIKEKAHVNNQNVLGDTPLHRAVWRNQTQIVQLLTNNPDIDIQIQNNEKQTPFDLVRKPDIGAILKERNNTVLWSHEEEDEESENSYDSD